MRRQQRVCKSTSVRAPKQSSFGTMILWMAVILSHVYRGVLSSYIIAHWQMTMFNASKGNCLLLCAIIISHPYLSRPRDTLQLVIVHCHCQGQYSILLVRFATTQSPVNCHSALPRAIFHPFHIILAVVVAYHLKFSNGSLPKFLTIVQVSFTIVSDSALFRYPFSYSVLLALWNCQPHSVYCPGTYDPAACPGIFSRATTQYSSNCNSPVARRPFKMTFRYPRNCNCPIATVTLQNDFPIRRTYGCFGNSLFNFVCSFP